MASTDPLLSYKKKREFALTPEPAGAVAKKKSVLSFVIQKHAARSDSAYVSRRSANWIKLKCSQRQEFVVVGYTAPQGARTGLGALLLGTHDQAGKLRYAGRVGTGFDTRTLVALKRQLSHLAVDKTPLFEKPKEAQGHWVKPKLVAEVSFAEWTKDGKVRHAVFHGLRTGRGATTIAAFSARARPGMGVSMPCSWKELPSLTGGAQWTIVNAHERLEAGADPWAGYANTRQTLTAAMKKLGLGR